MLTIIKVDDELARLTQGNISEINPKAINNSNGDTYSLKDSIKATYKIEYKELEKFFILFLSCLNIEEAEVLFKMMLKLFSLPKGTTMTQFQSILEHNLEEPNELKLITSYDTFKWTISNWKTCFTKGLK